MALRLVFIFGNFGDFVGVGAHFLVIGLGLGCGVKDGGSFDESLQAD